jgi:hypothetical protein
MARVSSNTVLRWCNEGRVAACKPAGRWHIYRREYVAWIRGSISLPPTMPPARRIPVQGMLEF